MKQKNIKSAVGGAMALILLGKLLGLFRDRLLAVSFDAITTDAFLTASRIPRVFFDAVFASAISISFIPVFSAVHERDGRQRALRFGAEVTGVFAIITLIVSALGVLFAHPLTQLFAPGYDAQKMELTASLTRIMFPTLFLTGVAYSFVGILQSLESFAVPAAISAVSNGLIVLYYYTLRDRFGISGLAVVFLIGWTAQLLVMVPSLKRRGFRLTSRLNPRSGDMRAVIKLMLPVLVSAWVQPVSLAIGTRFASNLAGDASVTAVELSSNLNMIIVGIFVLSVTNVLFPRISRLEATGQNLWKPVRASLGVSLYVALPAMCGVMLLAWQLVTVVYGGGQFGQSAIDATSAALRWGAPSMVGFTISAILGRVYFARHDGVRPLVAGVISIAVNIALCYLLAPPLGVTGIALASTSAITANAIILLIPLLAEGLVTLPFAKNLIKTCIGCAVMTAGAYGVMKWIPGGGLLECIAVAATGCIIYFAATYILGVRAAKMVRRTIFEVVGKVIPALARYGEADGK